MLAEIVPEQTSRIVSTGSEVEALAVRDLHAQMAQRGCEAIECIDKDERDVSGITMGISRATFERLRGEVKAFRERMMTIAAGDPSVERVYRLNLQLFPLSAELPEQKEEE